MSETILINEKLPEIMCKYIETLKLVSGSYVGKPFILMPWQKRFIYDIFSKFRKSDKKRIVSEAILSLGRKNSKDLSLNTLIPTPNGLMKNGDLNLYDVLYDENGATCRVIDIIDHKKRHVYDITFSNGETIRAGETHDWWLKKYGKSYKKFTTKEIFTKYINHRVYGKNKGVEYIYSTKIAGAHNNNKKNYDIDPYLLGVWLGDGKSNSNELTLGTKDSAHILGRIKCAYKIREESYEKDSVTSVTLGTKQGNINKVRNYFRDLNLFKNKHIPELYFLGSQKQRIELLRGLMDTDGSVSKKGQYTFICKKLSLAKDFRRLVSSLGIKTKILDNRTTCNGKSFHSYRLHFYSSNFIAVSLPRHVGRIKRANHKGSKRSNTLSIVKVEYAGVEDTRCIGVNSKSHLYLCGETGIITHNTETVAVIVLCFFMIKHLNQAEGQIIIASGSRDQASLLFDVLRKFIEYNGLSSHFRITPSKKHILHRLTNMSVQAVSADGNMQMGKNVYLFIADETGNWEQTKGSYLFEALQTSTGAQTEPLTISLSTQAPDDNHFFSKKVDYGLKVQKGEIIDPAFVAHIYTIPQDMDVLDPENWILANPSMEHIPTLIRTLEREAEKARHIPATMATFRQLLANQRYASSTQYMARDAWMACVSEYDVKMLHGRKAFCGLDLAGGRNDLASLQLLVLGDDDELYNVSYFWTGEEGLKEKADRDGVDYVTWRAQGHLQTTSGKTTDWAEFALILADIAEIYDIQEIFYDRWKIHEVQRELDKLALDLPLTAHGQGYVDATKSLDALENLVYEEKLHHNNNPCLTWCVSNAVVDIDPAGNKKLNKKKSTNRIDGIVALSMAAYAFQKNDTYVSTTVQFI